MILYPSGLTDLSLAPDVRNSLFLLFSSDRMSGTSPPQPQKKGENILPPPSVVAVVAVGSFLLVSHLNVGLLSFIAGHII